MKSKFLTVIISLSAVFLTGRSEEPKLTILSEQRVVGGFMPQCISANGKYICGSSYSQVGFISDWQDDNTLICNGQGAPRASTFGYITNEGKGQAGGTLIDFNTGKTEYNGASGYVDMMTEDGSICVGMTPNKRISEFGSAHYIEYDACYWEKGRRHTLPIPTEEELGYYYLRTRARCISADGSVILGEIVDRLYVLPMILWRRQPDGSYQLDAVCKDYFSDIKYNEGYYKEYVNFKGAALSKNGKWVAMILRDAPEYGQPAYGPLQVGLYNVETGELTKADIAPGLNISDNPRYEIYYNGVADDGTIVGYYKNDFGGESAFIMYPDDMLIRNFIDEFDTIGEFADFEDWGWNRVSSITPDGKYITGYGWRDSFDGSYEGYVLYTGTRKSSGDDENKDSEDEGLDSSRVGSVIDTDMGNPEYFDINGRRMSAPVKGISIVKYPDGSVRKILNRN